jgi:arylsulfatase A-like enzyme
MNDPRRRVGNRPSEQNPAYSPLRSVRAPNPGGEAASHPPGAPTPRSTGGTAARSHPSPAKARQADYVSEVRTRRSPRSIARRLAAALLLSGIACAAPPQDERPSFLLVVLDTARRDAISAYGEVEGTTPNVDALAREGVLYSLAFAPTPWTLPSHATMLTGLPVERHQVGLRGRLSLPEEVVTLAERLRDAGYQTAGFSENPLVGTEFMLSQGFEYYDYETIHQALAEKFGAEVPAFDVVEKVAYWARQRRTDRPFFVFVNLFDPHDPYTVREVNPFLPRGVDASRARAVQPKDEKMGGIAASVGMCDRIPSSADLAILRGLYLGDVFAADAKFGKIRALLVGAGPSRDLVTIVTSDHGEQLGEHRLLGHEFSVRNTVLNVPLVLHGLPGLSPGVRDEPVELVDLAPSILEWAGVEIPEDLPGRPLSAAPAASKSERPIVGLFADIYAEEPAAPDPGAAFAGVELSAPLADERRRGCGPEDRVFGNIFSLTRYPHKLIWFENGPAEIYDLSWDPHERSDQTSFHPELVAALEQELAEIRRRFEPEGTPSPPAPAPSPAAVEALRSMGYVE